MKAVIFDLDNTLYPEIDYVKSGFRAIAEFLCGRYGGCRESIFSDAMEILGLEGRGKVFDHLLERHGLHSPERVKTLLHVYRSHKPTLLLPADAVRLFEWLKAKRIRTGIITDGAACVQRNKVDALRLKNLVDNIVCTDELGRDCWKPSLIPYLVMLEYMNTRPSETAYVGDDVGKDFIAPNRLGMLSVLIRKHKAVAFPEREAVEEGEASVVINDLNGLYSIVEKRLINRELCDG